MKRASYTMADLPIPPDCVPTRKWTEQMLEMSDHIGPYATLQIIAAYGGQQIYIPANAAQNRMADVVGDAVAAILSNIYGCNTLSVPVGRAALDEARRGGVIAAIRSGDMTINAAVPILGTSRTYLSFLVNHTKEGEGEQQWAPLPRPKHDPRQTDIFSFIEADKIAAAQSPD